MLVSDIDNTLNALNVLIYRALSFPLHVYPAPLLPGFWSTPEGMEMLWDAPPLAGAAKPLRCVNQGGLAYVTCGPRDNRRPDLCLAKALRVPGRACVLLQEPC